MQPKGLGGRDSFSACQPADLFDHIRHPMKKSPSQSELKVIDLDTLAALAKGDQTEAMFKRLSAGQGNKPAYAFIKGSKIVLSLVLIPARLFLIVIPKLLMGVIFPKIAKFSEQVISKCFENINRLVQEVAARFQILLNLTESLKPFASVLKSFFNTLGKNFISPFKKGAAFAEKIVQRAIKSINESVKKGIKLTQKSLKKVSSFLLTPLKKLQSIIKATKRINVKALQLAKNGESEEGVTRQPIGLTIFNMASEFRNRLNFAFQNTKSALKASTKSMTQKVKTFATNAKKMVSKAVQPVVNRLKIHSKQALKMLTQAKKRISNAVLPKLKSLIEVVENTFEKVHQMIKPHAVLLIGWLSQATQSMTTLIFKNRGMQILKSKVAAVKKMTVKLQRIQAAILKSFKRVKEEAFKKFQHHKKKFLSKAKSLSDKVKKKITAHAQNLIFKLKRITGFFFGIFQKIAKLSVRLYKGAALLMRFTGFLIREISRELT